MERLELDGLSREEVVALARERFGDDLADLDHVSATRGGRTAALERLEKVNAKRYGRTRNFLDGDVTRMSMYIRHGVVTLDEMRRVGLDQADHPGQIKKYIQELAWRDYYQRVYRQRGAGIWEDLEPYKTGFDARDYEETLPDDITHGTTGVACIDTFIRELLETGYMHNHARMYVAAYVVHWRRVRWQAGASWFLTHLLDGDPASNNLSWQWVASTFSHKPYIFNLGNVRKYAHSGIDTSTENNRPLAGSYSDISGRLFPNLE